MNDFNSFRRDFLRVGSLGAAASAIPAVSLAAEAARTGKDSNGIFNVRTYGAAGDGKTLDTAAVNRAMEAAASSGGGVVLFPAGSYLCFSIHLKSHVYLHLQEGSSIIAANSPLPGETTGYNGGAYDAAEPNTAWDAYQDYGHNHWHNSLIWGEDIHDCGITGTGLIWGRGLSYGAMIGHRGDYPVYKAEQPGVGNKAIALKNCRNVQFRDFSVLKGGHFAFLLTGVDNLICDNLTVDTDRDGFDFDCCQNVHVSNCSVNSPWDDGICPKSSYALGYARPTRNMTIDSCYVSGYWELGTLLDGTRKKMAENVRFGHNGRIKCGTESNGGFINIAISNCIFEGCQGYALETVDGALLEDIAISNTTMRDLYSGPIFMRLGARLRGPKDSTKVGTLKRIAISNLTCYNAPLRNCSVLSGIPGYAIEDVKLSNIYIETVGGGDEAMSKIVTAEHENEYPEPGRFGPMPASGFYLRHMKHVEMSHVEIANTTPDARPAFHLHDVERADFFAVTAPRTADGTFVLDGVKDLRIGWSRAAADTVLATADGKTV
jgi:polygalacturonase